MSDFPHDSLNADEINPRSSRWLRGAAWIVALVVFEMTADPSLVVVVGCSKFGWEQLRAARWLRKSDPNKRRGRACRWFYVSWGVWRISIVATLMMFVVLFLFEGLRHAFGAAPRGGNNPPVQFLVAVTMAFFGFIFSTLTSFFGIISAWRSRVRLWVGQAGIAAFRARAWPPIGAGGERNRMNGLLMTAVPFAFVLGIFPPTLLVIGVVFEIVRKAVGEGAGVAVLMVLMVASMIGGACGLLFLMDHAMRRMEAASPADCWGDQAETPPPSSQITFGSALR